MTARIKPDPAADLRQTALAVADVLDITSPPLTADQARATALALRTAVDLYDQAKANEPDPAPQTMDVRADMLRPKTMTDRTDPDWRGDRLADGTEVLAARDGFSAEYVHFRAEGPTATGGHLSLKRTKLVRVQCPRPQWGIDVAGVMRDAIDNPEPHAAMGDPKGAA